MPRGSKNWQYIEEVYPRLISDIEWHMRTNEYVTPFDLAKMLTQNLSHYDQDGHPLGASLARAALEVAEDIYAELRDQRRQR